MPTVGQHRAALIKILAAADSYFVLHRQLPSRIRLGAAIAHAFMGEAAEVRFPLRPTEPKATVAIVADPTLGPDELAPDD